MSFSDAKSSDSSGEEDSDDDETNGNSNAVREKCFNQAAHVDS
jgi:hypothetical protein